MVEIGVGLGLLKWRGNSHPFVALKKEAAR